MLVGGEAACCWVLSSVQCKKPQMVLGNQGRFVGDGVGESRWKTGKSGDPCPI